jgi:hypothetical protein
VSWTLLFYRPAGEPELIIEEVDALFERMPRFTRQPSRDEDPLAENPVAFRYRNPISAAEFQFVFESPAGEEDAEEAVLPAETPLRLEVDYLQPPATAQEAIPIAAEVSQYLSLLALDPQSEAAAPGLPHVDALIRSYVGHNRDVQQTLVSVEARRRRYVTIGAVLLAVAVLLWLLGAVFSR